MKFREPTKPHRKSGVWGTRLLLEGEGETAACLAVPFVCVLRHAPARHKEQQYVNHLHR
jgi:hypothetical protein